ncbi:hypothetical protein [Absidia glauca]|uniref:RanBD1 domain-containing protein n=1 Tax=Absidia glauca TaxID=4829 RepID=A0A168QWE7_ABSGL|nr:hypothetical protein [Absidia glauca]
MSSPPDSIHDMEDAASKKRGRAQSVEPTTPAPKDEEVETDKTSTVSAPKKTKRDEVCTSNGNSKGHSVRTIRKNMKDMSTTDTASLDDTAIDEHTQRPDSMHSVDEENGSDSQSIDNQSQQHGDDITDGSPSPPTTESQGEDKEEETPSTTKPLSRFVGNSDSGWNEFAQEEEQQPTKPSTSPTDKSKYTFGSSSGFGTKGWNATHQTTPISQRSPSLVSGSVFGSSSAAAAAAGTATTGSFSSYISSPSTAKSTTSAFGAFASAPSSTSPFALAASNNNAFASLPKPTDNDTTSPAQPKSPIEATEATTFGAGSKLKVPGVKQTEVKTGEEDEQTVYQHKAKLLVLDTKSNYWKERGSGTFRINVKNTTSQARLVMRTDSVYRLILNLLLFPEIKVFLMQERFVRFAGFESETKEDGSLETKLVNYALKMGNPVEASELCHRITSRIPSK